MLYVIALGGNALLQRGEPQTYQYLIRNITLVAQALKPILQNPANRLLIVHGNGPQVGLLALQSPDPFDVLVAETQGMIGYLLQQALSSQTNRQCVSLITQVCVNAQDPAFFQVPTKAIGPAYKKTELHALTLKHPDWILKPEGKFFRRMVFSPKPKEIYELKSINALLAQDTIVIAGGGGGIPCVDENNRLKGIEAVIDKDRTASLLAQQLQADVFIILTDVSAVYEDFETDSPREIRIIDSHALASKKNLFPTGSMRPKIESAIDFVNQTQKSAFIGHLGQVSEILARTAGTEIIFAKHHLVQKFRQSF